MTDLASAEGRAGEVMRVLAHGTVIIWDPAAERAYPFYKAGHEKYHAREYVQFLTDTTDTYVVAVTRSGGDGSRKARHETAIERVYLTSR
jgi:hypothetical protein